MTFGTITFHILSIITLLVIDDYASTTELRIKYVPAG
jgi:hypothetical protein